MSSGIYKVTNLRTGQFYIGQSTNLAQRERTHRHNVRHNPEVQGRLYRDGFLYCCEADLAFEVLEECPLKMLDAREYAWIVALRPPLNTAIQTTIPEPDDSTICQKAIVTAMKNQGMTMMELSHRSGVSYSRLHDWLARSGKQSAVQATSLEKLFDALGLVVAEGPAKAAKRKGAK